MMLSLFDSTACLEGFWCSWLCRRRLSFLSVADFRFPSPGLLLMWAGVVRCRVRVCLWALCAARRLSVCVFACRGIAGRADARRYDALLCDNGRRRLRLRLWRRLYWVARATFDMPWGACALLGWR